MKYKVGDRVRDLNTLKKGEGTITQISSGGQYIVDWDSGTWGYRQEDEIEPENLYWQAYIPQTLASISGSSQPVYIRMPEGAKITILEPKPKVCTCGSKFTSNPNYHSSWCDIELSQK